MKNVLRLLFLLSAVLMFFSSCVNNTEDELFNLEFSEITELDFGGYEFVLRGGYYPEINQSVIGDAVLDRYRKIEEECNIKFNVLPTVYANYSSTLLMNMAASTKYADLMCSWIEHMFGVYRAGMLMPISDNGYFDVEQEKYGTVLALDAVRFDGENVYGVQANQWPQKSSNFFNFVLFNHAIMSEFGFTSPYELLESGKWTWDVFREMALTATDAATERWGVSTEHDEFPLCAIFSNNGKLLKQLPSGEYIWGYTEPEVIEALEWCQTLVLEDKSIYQNPSSDAWATMWAFTEGRTAFHVGPSYFGLGTITGGERDEMFPLVGLPETGFGWVPFPFGPKNIEQTWNIAYDHMESYYNIPLDATLDTNVIFQVIDLLFEPIPEVPSWQEYYGRYLFTESTGFEIYLEMLERASVSYLHIWGGERSTMVTMLANMMRTKVSVTQQIDPIKDVMQSIIDEIYN